MSNQMTPVGVPEELVFNLPMSMLDSRKIEQRIQPYSQARYTSPGQVAKFTIPQTDRTLASGQTMYLTGKLKLDKLTKDKRYAVLGSHYSLFSRQVVNANGTVLETIERPGELVNQLINMTMNAAEKIGQANSLGTGSYADEDSTSNISLLLGNKGTLPIDAAGTYQTVSFAIPLIGVLDTNKYIPMWNSNIELELTINDITNWLVPIDEEKLSGTTFLITDLELVFDSIELSPESFNMIMANNPQKIVIKSQSYLYGSSGLSQNAGAQDIPINARLASMKQLYFYFTSSSLVDKTFGGVNCNLYDVVFITNGKYHPQRPIKCTNPSECYMQIQKAFGSVKSYSHSGCIGKTEFCRRDARDADIMYNTPILPVKPELNSDGSVKTPGNNQQLISKEGGGNKFYLAIDTEIINTNKNSLYNGISTGVNSNIRVNIAEPTTLSYTCNYWCCYDILLEMDFITGITRSIY